MNREILFKAKRIDNGEWTEGYPHRHRDHWTMWKDGIGVGYCIDANTLCQYTGLTDKNGNKIWENDVLDADEVNSLVRFDEENARFVLDDYGIKGCLMEYGFDENAGGYGFIETNGFDDFMDITEAVEVIGNIFDNPELLGGADNV